MGLTQEFQLESSSRTEFLRGLKKTLKSCVLMFVELLKYEAHLSVIC